MSSHASPWAESLPLPPWTTIAFSGHRSLEQPELVAGAIARALDAIAKLRPQLAATSSAASGSDTLFAEAALRRGLPLTIVLPFPRVRFAQDFADDPDGWRRAEAVIDAATFVDEVPCAESDEAAYMEAGVRTIDAADMLIVVWDGKPGKGFGGTADARKYAVDLGKPVVVIDPATGQFDETPIRTLGPGPKAQRDRLTAEELKNPLAVVRQMMVVADEQANEHAPKARKIVLWYVILHLIASALLVIKIGFAIHGPVAIGLAGFELFALAVAFFLVRVHHRRHAEWVWHRAHAEICRTFLATWQIRRRTATRLPKAPPLAFELVFRTLRLLRAMDRSPMLSLAEASRAYEKDRVQHQIDHFREKGNVARAWRGRLQTLVWFATWIAASLTVLSVILSLAGVGGHPIESAHSASASTLPHVAMETSATEHGSTAPSPWADFFFRFTEVAAALAPLVTAAVGTIILTNELARRAVRYEEMVLGLTAQLRHVRAAPTWETLARVATQVEEELLLEAMEWQAFTRVTAQLH
jgi:hypothetical protein